jgi:hypothetical protein
MLRITALAGGVKKSQEGSIQVRVVMEVVNDGATKVSQNEPENRPHYVLHGLTHRIMMP